MNARAHWERVYQGKAPDAFSWYRPHLDTSLDLVRQAAPSTSASIIDAGAGESTLVDDLLASGYENITLLDISATALDATKARLGPRAAQVRWIVGDAIEAELPPACYDIWHDRAVFHFLTGEDQRTAYVRQVLRAVRRGGHVIIGTFGPEGPRKCSGLDVVRYNAALLHDQFGRHFRLLDSREELHRTPFGTTQQFLYCYCILE
ncbi:MAG TPA: class I SAM-dependent methyltransferase [Bryobacteraceae bacterium]|nr:class I SAM-dependent methyltransferase [Bryobacteraceae bacterium]